MKKTILAALSLAIAFCLVMFAGPGVQAAEPDTNFDEGWLERMENAELSVVFRTVPCTDGAYAQSMWRILQDRFTEDPYGFVEALSLETEDIQDAVLLGFSYEVEFSRHLLTIANLLDPAELDTNEARQVMAELQRIIRIAFGAENPGTGDPIWIVASLMAASAAAGTLLLIHKKRFV